MAFSKKVRERALVASARHCCVCRRYKGMKVEVHHIRLVADGGTDQEDNAIALCFDCHADAGHYNPKHPRGSRFSQSELRSARDRWHEIVRSGNVGESNDSNGLHVRYLVSKSLSAAAELLARPSLTWLAPAYLASSHVRTFQERVLSFVSEGRRPDSIESAVFTDASEYQVQYPDIEIGRPSPGHLYPYFRARRCVGKDEALSRVVPADPLAYLLMDCGIDASDLCIALGYDELCGAGVFAEIYGLRPVLFVFMQIRNLGPDPVRLHRLTGIAEPDSFPPRAPASSGSQSIDILDLPTPALLPAESLIVPICTLLGPAGGSGTETVLSQDFSSCDSVDGGTQVVSHEEWPTLTRDFETIGSAFWPSQILLSDGRGVVNVHALDLGNLYTIDRFWEMGSCPHLFSINFDGSRTYIGEIFATAPSLEATYTFCVPDSVVAVELVELEEEVTFLRRLAVNGSDVVVGHWLRQGESVLVSVRPGEKVTLEGFYLHRSEANAEVQPIRRNSVVRTHLNSPAVVLLDPTDVRQLRFS